MTSILKQKSKAHVITWSDGIQGLKSIVSVSKGLPKEIVWRDATEFYNHDCILQLFDMRPVFIVLPLTLPKFNSVRIAEYAHWTKSRTKVILISRTYCPSNILHELFDDHIITPELTTERFEKAIRTKPTRDLSGKQIRSVIQQILNRSSCSKFIRQVCATK